MDFENTLVLVLGKRQYNAVHKWREYKKYKKAHLTEMKFPFYTSLSYNYHHTAVGYEHIYHPDSKLINFNQFLNLTKS